MTDEFNNWTRQTDLTHGYARLPSRWRANFYFSNQDKQRVNLKQSKVKTKILANNQSHCVLDDPK